MVLLRSGEASRLESAIASAEASQAFIEQLASAGDDDRERMLMEWMKQRDDGEVSKPIVSTRKRRKTVKKEEVEKDKLVEADGLPEVRTFFLRLLFPGLSSASTMLMVVSITAKRRVYQDFEYHRCLRPGSGRGLVREGDSYSTPGRTQSTARGRGQ